MRKQWRQGDVVLEAGYYLVDGTKQKRVVLAEGEKTGHAHVLESEQEFGTMVERDGTLYLQLPAEGKVTHPEHATVTVPPGDYVVRKQHEYDPKAEYRPVAD